MISNTALRRVAIVLGGYVLAFGVALGFVSLHIVASHTPDRQTAQGMYAFGDTVVFLGVFALASLPATGAALFFLRGKPRFWIVLASIAVGVAMTGVVWALAYHLVPYSGAHSLIQVFSLLFPLRAPRRRCSPWCSCLQPSWRPLHGPETPCSWQPPPKPWSS